MIGTFKDTALISQASLRKCHIKDSCPVLESLNRNLFASVF